MLLIAISGRNAHNADHLFVPRVRMTLAKTVSIYGTKIWNSLDLQCWYTVKPVKNKEKKRSHPLWSKKMINIKLLYKSGTFIAVCVTGARI